MENNNAIMISPVDVDVRIRAKSVKIWNDFKNKGFTRRAAFVHIVQESDPNYKDFEKEKQLFRFWNGRFCDQFMNDDLEKILDKISAE